MKILHVLWRPKIGGAELFTIELARLQSVQHDVEVHYLGAMEEDDLPRADSVKTSAGGQKSGFDMVGLLRFRRRVTTGGFDIIHHHQNLPAVVASLGLRTGKTIIIKHEHGATGTKWRPLRERLLTRIIQNGIDMYLANSSHTRDEMIRWGGIPQNKIRVVPCGIDIARFLDSKPTSDLRRTIGANDNARIVGCIGRLVEDKGIEYFIEVARLVRQRRKDCEFVIVGDGPLREKLEADVKRQGVSGHVHFLGFRLNIPELLRDMDILLVTSVREAQGIAAIEAMAAEVPVVSFAVGGLSDIVEGAGVLVGRGDSLGMADSVNKLLKNRDGYVDIVSAGLDRAKTFNMTTISEDVLAIYRELSRK